jgi:hypothetical protein
MAERLIAAVDRKDQVEYSRKLALSAQGDSWEKAGHKVVSIFDKAIERK